MSNELLMISTAIVDLIIVLIAFRLGREYLIAVIVINLAMVSLTAAKIGTVFGIAASPQTIFYAAIFLGTDLISEYHGKKAGHRAVFCGFLGLVLLVLFGQVVVHFAPLPDFQEVSNSIAGVFGSVGRIAIASFVAYMVSQNLDIWLFHRIKDATGNSRLWLRNNVSTFISQFIDTIIFFPIAFYGVLPNDVLISVMFFAYLVKIIVALIDTPFMYLAKYFKPAELRNSSN